MNLSRKAIFMMLLPGLGFMILFFVLPILMLFVSSFSLTDQYGNVIEGWTTEHYEAALTRPYFLNALQESLVMSAQVSVICCVLGYIAAYSIYSTNSRILKPVLYAIVISPLLTSVIARSFGWIVLLSRGGVVNETMQGLGLIDSPMRLLYTGPATLVAVTQVLLPFAVLPILSALVGVSPDISRASRILGASATRTFLSIVLPLTLRGVFAGGTLVFSLAMGIYITPILVGGVARPLSAVRIYEQVMNFFHMPQAAALSFILLATTLAFVSAAGLAFSSWYGRRFG